MEKLNKIATNLYIKLRLTSKANRFDRKENAINKIANRIIKEKQ